MMKKEVKKSWQKFFKTSLLLTLLLFVISGVSAMSGEPETVCPGPNVSVTGQTASSLSFSWDAVSEATAYHVYYVRKEDNYTSSVMSTGSTSITVSGLTPGTYSFHFATICGGGSSGYIIVDDLVMM